MVCGSGSSRTTRRTMVDTQTSCLSKEFSYKKGRLTLDAQRSCLALLQELTAEIFQYLLPLEVLTVLRSLHVCLGFDEERDVHAHGVSDTSRAHSHGQTRQNFITLPNDDSEEVARGILERTTYLTRKRDETTTLSIFVAVEFAMEHRAKPSCTTRNDRMDHSLMVKISR